MPANLEIGLILLQELALLVLPALAAVMFAAALGMRSPVLRIGTALAASGVAAMLVFWGFYATPEVGKTLAFLIELGSALAAIALWFGAREREVVRGAARELATPVALWGLASFFVAYLGFMHGTSGETLTIADNRYLGGLPADAGLPGVFADWFYNHGHHGTPPVFAEWLASDRPPLQIGYVLNVRPFGWDTIALHYELVGIAVQQLWVFGAWALLRAVGLGRRARALAMFAALFSDIVIVHGFFVWPKLIAAAFLLAAMAMVFSPEWKRWSRDPRAAVLFAALCTFSMLSHGSSAFVLLPLVAFAVWRARPDWRAGPTWRWIGVAIAAAIVLYAPWQAYVHWGDPPGNRLVKWQLGGSDVIDERGVLETIVDGYREEGLGGTLGNKWQNIQAMVGVGEVRAVLHGEIGDHSRGDLAYTMEDLRWVRFLALFPAIGFLLLGPLALAFRAAVDRGGGRGPEWRFAIGGGLLALASCLVWALVMFGNPISEAVIHQGSLALPLLAFFVCAAAAYAVAPAFAIALVGLNSLFVLALYVPSFTPPEGSSVSVPACLAAAVAALAFCLVAWRAADPAEGLHTAPSATG